jgi:hypothetical protein
MKCLGVITVCTKTISKLKLSSREKGEVNVQLS